MKTRLRSALNLAREATAELLFSIHYSRVFFVSQRLDHRGSRGRIHPLSFLVWGLPRLFVRACVEEPSGDEVYWASACGRLLYLLFVL